MLMAMLLCFSRFVNIGTTTAFAAGTETEGYLIAFPRDGDENYRTGDWGHENLAYMNGWSSGESKRTHIRTVGAFNGPICTGYTQEEMDAPVRYVIPDSQSAVIERNTVTRKTFENRLKKWNATVTKRDGETGSSQGGGSFAGAVYGVYQGGKLIDTYTTNSAGQFTTDCYPCGDNWSIREIAPPRAILWTTPSTASARNPAATLLNITAPL